MIDVESKSLIGRVLPPIRGAGCAAYTMGMCAGAELHKRAAGGLEDELWDGWMRRWAKGVLTIFGVRVTLDGPLPPPPCRARLVVANHRSPIDVVILLSLFGGRILSRGDLARWPVLGAAARQAGTIFVDRESRGSGARAIREIRRHLAAGDTITVFPEGGTFPGDEVRPFRAGAFVTARGLDVEVVPVGLAYPPKTEFWQESFVAHVGRVAGRPRTNVVVTIGEGSSASGRAVDVAKRMHAEVQTLTHRARARLEGL